MERRYIAEERGEEKHMHDVGVGRESKWAIAGAYVWELEQRDGLNMISYHCTVVEKLC